MRITEVKLGWVKIHFQVYNLTEFTYRILVKVIKNIKESSKKSQSV